MNIWTYINNHMYIYILNDNHIFLCINTIFPHEKLKVTKVTKLNVTHLFDSTITDYLMFL